MIVHTRWPALVPAIERAGHQPVLDYPLDLPDQTDVMRDTAGAAEAELPPGAVTARPRGAQRRPR